ncbi:MAG: helix-turn-helix domain-containing protein [Rubrivivax sp.]
MTAPLHTTPPERIAALHAIRDRHRGDGQATQAARLLEALQTLSHVTTFEASRYLDLYDPRARKLNLVKAGYQVLTTWRTVETESGERHRVGVYSLLRGAQ